MTHRVDAQLGNGSLVNLLLGTLVLHGFDPDRAILLDETIGENGMAALNRMNLYIDNNLEKPEGCVLDTDDCAYVFGDTFRAILGDNVPKGHQSGTYDKDWRNTQRRALGMLVEGRDPATFTEEDDFDEDRDNEALEKLRASATTDSDDDADADDADDGNDDGASNAGAHEEE